MKKKELMKRLSAIAMAAMMTVTMIPSNAFAADIDFSDGGQETIEVQADAVRKLMRGFLRKNVGVRESRKSDNWGCISG